jgi:hypothetical protein
MNIFTIPISFVVGTVYGTITGVIIDLSIIHGDPLHYANSFPSGVIVGMYIGGPLGVISDFLIRDNGVIGGIVGGIVGGVGGLFSPKRI